MSHNDDTVQLDVQYLNETKSAALFSDGDSTFWIPKSQLVDFSGARKGTRLEITCSEWFAVKEGLV